LQDLFDTQLDIVPLRSFDIPVYRNEVPAPIASGADGVAWVPDGTGYRRPPLAGSAAVVVAANADDRWGPGEWRQDGWAGQIITSEDRIGFAGYEPRRNLALGSVGWLGVLLAVMVFGWWRSRS
jgi:hypothetical protein